MFIEILYIKYSILKFTSMTVRNIRVRLIYVLIMS